MTRCQYVVSLNRVQLSRRHGPSKDNIYIFHKEYPNPLKTGYEIIQSET